MGHIGMFVIDFYKSDFEWKLDFICCLCIKAHFTLMSIDIIIICYYINFLKATRYFTTCYTPKYIPIE